VANTEKDTYNSHRTSKLSNFQNPITPYSSNVMSRENSKSESAPRYIGKMKTKPKTPRSNDKKPE